MYFVLICASFFLLSLVRVGVVVRHLCLVYILGLATTPLLLHRCSITIFRCTLLLSPRCSRDIYPVPQFISSFFFGLILTVFSILRSFVIFFFVSQHKNLHGHHYLIGVFHLSQ